MQRQCSPGRVIPAALLPCMTAACITLDLRKPESVNLYQLDVGVATVTDGGGNPAGSLVISQPRARPGFDGPNMVYVSQAHQLQSFAHNEWVDTPARMLAPLLIQAMERSDRFQPVSPGPETGARFRLDTEIVRLQQEFITHPSQVRFVLGIRLTDLAARRVLLSREVEAVETAPTDDAYGGVVAGNAAVGRVLADVVALCGGVAESARIREQEPREEEPGQPPPAKPPPRPKTSTPITSSD